MFIWKCFPSHRKLRCTVSRECWCCCAKSKRWFGSLVVFVVVFDFVNGRNLAGCLCFWMLVVNTFYIMRYFRHVTICNLIHDENTLTGVTQQLRLNENPSKLKWDASIAVLRLYWRVCRHRLRLFHHHHCQNLSMACVFMQHFLLVRFFIKWDRVYYVRLFGGIMRTKAHHYMHLNELPHTSY